MVTKDIEAQISLPDGTQIALKGSKNTVTDILSVVTRGRGQGGDSGGLRGGEAGAPASAGKLAGVAERDDGSVHIVATDLKAKSAKEAAHRLVYVTLLARRALLNERKSPRKALVETLKGYNLYDGNSRALIVKDKGLVREGRKNIWLSQPAVEVAWRFVKEIQDSNLRGTWGLSAGRTRRTAGRAKGGRMRSA